MLLLLITADWVLFSDRVSRDVPSDITIEVDGDTFSLHKVRLHIMF